MITKIRLKNVASYKQEVLLETDKKINLIYGLNGTGKSTLSNYLQNLADPNFSECSIESSINSGEVEIFVYNQKYIDNQFYNSPSQKGIFSLSKGNKDAKDAIDKAISEITRLSVSNETKEKEKTTLDDDFLKNKKTAIDTIWKIKKDYYGGDRVLEYCLKGYMGSGENLFNYIKELVKPTTVVKDIDKIKEEVQLLNDGAQKIENLPLVQINTRAFETDFLLQKAIVGSTNSTFSDLIQRLGNSDWVQTGMEYISLENNNNKCPFCQQPIDKKYIVKELTNCFDEAYKKDKEKLNQILSSYNALIDTIKVYPEFDSVPLLKNLKSKYLLAYKELENCIKSNYNSLENKVEHPSTIISLTDSSNLLNNLNRIIIEANKIITEFNHKIEKKDEVLNQLKIDFWNNMRLKYDTTLSNFIREEKDFKIKKQTIINAIRLNDEEITKQNSIITEQQKKTVNIQDAIDHINTGLTDLGMDNFYIEKFNNDLYQIKRGENSENIFRSLSEGEKMIISFLYFIEECKGKKSATESDKKRIIVIDDPISSLSHIYVFNIGRFIHNEFLRSKQYEQVFILTHSLYFFYELAKKTVDVKKLNEKEQKEEKDKEQKLFRISKTKNGSCITIMKYNEIQNDYQVYWSVVKNNDQPALLANCMRNIIDYFYSFVLKDEFNNVFNEPELRNNNRFDAFCRYMNRESHSDGQNIFDIKEFDYDAWKEAFKLVFEKTGYKEHYKRMMK